MSSQYVPIVGSIIIVCLEHVLIFTCQPVFISTLTSLRVHGKVKTCISMEKKSTISPFLCFLVDDRVHDSAHSVTDCQVTRPFNSAPLCSLPSQVVVTHGPSRTDVRRSSVTLSRSLRYPLYPCLKKKVPFFRQRR